MGFVSSPTEKSATMKLLVGLVLTTSGALSLATAITFPSDHPPVPWKPAGLNDERSPCPLLNALANHGYLPHDGKDLSEEKTVHVLENILSIGKELAVSLFKGGLTTNPDANATTFSLADLKRHNILEHDASLSRQDFYFGDDHTFNQATFDQTRSHWRDTMIDVQSAARARLARVHTSNATNPTFSLEGDSLSLSYGESAAYLLVFGNKSDGTVKKAYIEYLFENERLPYALGWTRAADIISPSDFDGMSKRIVKATEELEQSGGN